MKTQTDLIEEAAVDLVVDFGASLSMPQRKSLLRICDECRKLGAPSAALGPLFASLFLIPPDQFVTATLPSG